MLRIAIVLIAGAVLAAGAVFAAAPVKIAQVAQVEDLMAEVNAILEEIGKNLANDQAFEQNGSLVQQSAAVLTVLAQAIAETEQASPMKPSAPALREAAKKLVAAENFNDAKQAYEAAKAAAAGQVKSTSPVEHAWDELAELHPLMEELNSRAAKVSRELRRLRKPDEARRHATVMTLIAVVTYSDTSWAESVDALPKKSDAVQQLPGFRKGQQAYARGKWHKHARELQESMTELTEAIKAKDTAKAKTLLNAGMETCKKCHEAFDVVME